MQTVYDVVREDGADSRVVRLLGFGVRTVDVMGDGYWVRYVIVPRKSILAHVRWLFRKGYRVSTFTRVDDRPDADYRFFVLPGQTSDLFSMERYSGPGRSFSRRPHCVIRNRRYWVFRQSGGLDI
jgi:hypothetical protein